MNTKNNIVPVMSFNITSCHYNDFIDKTIGFQGQGIQNSSSVFLSNENLRKVN